MYFPYFIAYIVIGLVIAATVFFWAIHSGQFQDQQRARFLALEADSESGAAKVSQWKRYEIYLLFFLACAGLLSSAAVLVFALVSSVK
jgi:cbb3-type cytochrome oxidase maturation protein